MKMQTVKTAISEAKRFIKVAEKIKPYQMYSGEILSTECEQGRVSAAAKRASLDLSNILADMRGNK